MGAWRLYCQNNQYPSCAGACAYEGHFLVNVYAHASAPFGCQYILWLWCQSTLHDAIRNDYRENEPEDQPELL